MTYTDYYDPEPSRFQIEHDREKRLFEIIRPSTDIPHAQNQCADGGFGCNRISVWLQSLTLAGIAKPDQALDSFRIDLPREI